MPKNIGLSNQVIARNGFGRFMARTDAAVTRSIEEAIEEGADLSRGFAPTGSKHDPRTVPLRDSISTEMLSSTAGRWRSDARHALAQERGARPHGIPGNVSFWWEAEGRWWVPGENIINHPGHGPQPFLRPAYEIIKRRLISILRRNMP